MADYDHIVVGLGAAGIGTLRSLAAQGADVLGIEQGPVTNPDATSYGLTRLFRFAYEDATYAPILKGAMDGWCQLEQDHDETLFFQTGSLDFRHESNDGLPKMIATCEAHGLTYEVLSPDEVANQYDLFSFPESYDVLYQPDSGLLDARACLRVQLQDATQNGATVHAYESVESWEETADHVAVETSRGTYTADSLVVTTGAWAAEQFDEIGDLLTVDNHAYAHFLQVGDTAGDLAPGFTARTDDQHLDFYGLVEPSKDAIKLGSYNNGDKQMQRPPSAFTRGLRESSGFPERETLAEFFTCSSTGATRGSCMITNTPDEDPILDTVTDGGRVVAGVGLSGHGFKLSYELGNILADLAQGIEPAHDIEQFRLDRFEGAEQA